MFRSQEFSDKKELIEDDPTGNWNFSQRYSEELIFNWFLKCDDYTTIAKFGTSAILEDFQIQDNIQTKNKLKIKALGRLADGILRIYKNSYFAVKYPNDKKTMDDLKEDIEKLESKIYLAYDTMKKDNEIYIKINDEVFNTFLKKFTSTLETYKECLNKSNLIFIYKPLFNAREHKKKVMEEMAKSG